MIDKLERKMKNWSIRIIFLLGILVVFSACEKNLDLPERPNIILIYADDLGKGLLGHEGQKIINTPNIDRLAKEGIRFENAYAGMLCAPSRASLITGLHDCHKGKFEITAGSIYKNISTGEYSYEEIENKLNKALSPVPDNQFFLGDVAKKAGYNTAQFGKLEWGFASTHKQMQQHGWDLYLGYLDHVRAHGFYPPFLFQDGKVKAISGNTRADCGKTGEPETQINFSNRWEMTGKEAYSQNLFMEGIINFIRSNKGNPFFLYFPTQLPHGPVSIPVVHPDFVNDDRLTQIEKEYASMVKMLDDNVGQIMDELKSLKLDENTIVIFNSDNGHEIYYAQKGRVHKPYTNMKTGERFDDLTHKFYSELGGDVFNGNGGRAGLKRSNLQGGISVPLIIRWPEKIRQGRNSDLLVANYDILSTIADVTGYSKPVNTDGISFYNELIEKNAEIEHEHIVFSSFLGPTLITSDGWKIRSYLSSEVFELYYLPDDYKEENDLSDKYPEKVKSLKNSLLHACDGDFNNGLFQNAKNLIDVE